MTCSTVHHRQKQLCGSQRNCVCHRATVCVTDQLCGSQRTCVSQRNDWHNTMTGTLVTSSTVSCDHTQHSAHNI